MSWIFDGIGTEIISIVVTLIVGLITGGGIGYKIGKKAKIKQLQKAKGNAEQKQQVSISSNEDCPTSIGKSKLKLNQTQKAGKESNQVQIGKINDGK